MIKVGVPTSIAPVYYFTVAPSRIQGQGVFNKTSLPARRKIGELRGPILPLPQARRAVAGRRKIYLVELDHQRALDCSKAVPFKYLNHSCQSNCYLRICQDRVEVYTLRVIEPGEELTVNYHETPHKGGMKCQCGAPGCVGRI